MFASQRSVGVAVAAAAGVAFLVAAWVLVPWQIAPGSGSPVTAAEAFTADEIARAESYAWSARAWSWGSLAVQLLVVSLLALTRVREGLARRLPGPWWVRVLIAVVVVSVVTRLATLPFSVGLQVHRLDAGLATQRWPAWARDVVVGLALSAAVTGLAVLVVVALARRWRRVWPVLAAGLAGGLVVVGSWVYPLAVEPLFNEFEPLADGALRSEILRTAQREDVAVEEVLVADASRRTTSLNAYVSGIGSTRRVVLYDTLVESVPPDQVLAVVAHELAHARHRDVVVGTTLGAFGAAAGVGMLAIALGRTRPRGAAAVPLLLALVAWGTVLSAPVENGVSRRIETRADLDALEATGDPAAFTDVQLSLARRSLADPTPPGWSHWWWGSHPTVLERLGLAAERR